MQVNNYKTKSNNFRYPIKTKIRKYFPNCGWFSGEVTAIVVVNATTLYYNVKYDDGDEEELDEEEIGQLLTTAESAYEEDEERKSFVWVTIGKRKYPGKILAGNADGYPMVKCTKSGKEFAAPGKIEKKVDYQKQYKLAVEFFNAKKNQKKDPRSSPASSGSKRRRIQCCTSGQLLWDMYPHISITQVISNIRNILPKELQQFANNIGTFCLFNHERQCIWKRRNEDGVVWSENEIFAKYFFCNIYRELDRGTCYFHSQMIHAYHAKKPQTRYEWILFVLWASYSYRQVNKVETFMEFKNNTIPTIEEFSEYEQFVKRKHMSNETFFTGAHQTSNCNQYILFLKQTLKDDAKLLKYTARKISDTIDAAHQKDTSSRDHETKQKTVADGDAIRTCFEEIKRLPGLGKFFAWQVTCDLIESNCFVNNDPNSPNKDTNDAWENAFCALGPGAILGIDLLFPGAEKYNYSKLELAKLVTEKINEVFDHDLLLLSKSNRNETYFPKWNQKSLTLKNVEHSLCEYSKYIRIEEKYLQKDDQDDSEDINLAPGHRLMKLRSNLDLDKPCQICNENKDNGLFCDSCLNFSCEDCEKEACAKQPTSYICKFCKQFHRIKF